MYLLTKEEKKLKKTSRVPRYISLLGSNKYEVIFKKEMTLRINIRIQKARSKEMYLDTRDVFSKVITFLQITTDLSDPLNEKAYFFININF